MAGLLSINTQANTDATFLGASLYASPLQASPRVNDNFTVTIKTDSLSQPINAASGHLSYNSDRLEIINISKIGSVFNIWLEEPNYSNLEGVLRFQGGLPAPGFIGNGGTVLHIIFKAKTPGVTSLVWKKAEILAHDGKGTNILTNLQNYDFVVDEPLSASNLKDESSLWKNPFLIINFALLLFLAFDRVRSFVKSNFKSLISSVLRVHDKQFHDDVQINNTPPTNFSSNPPNNPSSNLPVNQSNNLPANLPANNNHDHNL